MTLDRAASSCCPGPLEGWAEQGDSCGPAATRGRGTNAPLQPCSHPQTRGLAHSGSLGHPDSWCSETEEQALILSCKFGPILSQSHGQLRNSKKALPPTLPASPPWASVDQSADAPWGGQDLPALPRLLLQALGHQRQPALCQPMSIHRPEPGPLPIVPPAQPHTRGHTHTNAHECTHAHAHRHTGSYKGTQACACSR